MSPKSTFNCNSNSGAISELSDILLQLKDSTSGHVAAYKDLLSSSLPPKMTNLYSDLAEKEWLNVHKNKPDDWVACHHLAVLYHAKAYDLEADGKTEQAYEYWAKSHRFWRKLFEVNQPFDSIHKLIREMDSYNDKVHESELKDLPKLAKRDLMNLHRKLYAHHLDKSEADKADCHYSIVENSGFSEASNVLKAMYENKQGKKVEEIIKRFNKTESDVIRIEISEGIEQHYDSILRWSKKHKPPAPAIRDLIKLEGYKLNIEILKWIDGLGEYKKKIESIENRGGIFASLQISIEYIKINESRAAAGLLTEVEANAYNKIVALHNENYKNFQRLQTEIEEEVEKYFRKFTFLEKYLYKAEEKLRELNQISDEDCMKSALNEFRTVLNNSLMKAEGIGGVKDNETYKKFSRRCNRFISSIAKYQTGTGDSGRSNSINKDGKPLVWDWTFGANGKENPYEKTCFLIFEGELPSEANDFNINDLAKKLKKKKKKLEAKAKSPKGHKVLGQKVLVEQLNRSYRRLDDPISLACDMILQHQAHHADFDGIRKKLSVILLPAPEEAKYELTPEIFSLLPSPKPPTQTLNTWKKPGKELPEQPKLKINWPT